MTCFWDSLINHIHTEDFTNLFNYAYSLKPRPAEFITLLKNNNIKTSNIFWNNEILSEQLLNENYEAISNLDINLINNGYLCSCCDPFLLLICELFKVSINHNYNGTQITYFNKKKTNYTMNFNNNLTHFYI